MSARILAMAAALTLAAPALAQERYALDPAHTISMFEVSHAGMSLQRGLFTRASGTVTLDRAAKMGTIDVAIDAASVFTGDALRDRFVRGEIFLDADKHAAITFRSTKLSFDGDVLVAADGDLTLLGVTRPLQLRVAQFRCGIHPLSKRALCGADIAATIRRSDFGMTAHIPAVGDEIRLAIQVEGLRE